VIVELKLTVKTDGRTWYCHCTFNLCTHCKEPRKNDVYIALQQIFHPLNNVVVLFYTEETPFSSP